jgi:hypothetical protein
VPFQHFGGWKSKRIRSQGEFSHRSPETPKNPKGMSGQNREESAKEKGCAHRFCWRPVLEEKRGTCGFVRRVLARAWRANSAWKKNDLDTWRLVDHVEVGGLHHWMSQDQNDDDLMNYPHNIKGLKLWNPFSPFFTLEFTHYTGIGGLNTMKDFRKWLRILLHKLGF